MKLVFGGLLRQIVRNLHKLFGRKRVSDLLRNLGQRLLRFAADRNRQRRKPLVSTATTPSMADTPTSLHSTADNARRIDSTARPVDSAPLSRS